MIEFVKIARNSRDEKNDSRILKTCKKLEFENVIIEVCRILRIAFKKSHSVSQNYDVKDFQKILQILHQIARVDQELNIHNVFVQMMLTIVINLMIDDKQFQDFKKIISHLTDCYLRFSAKKDQNIQQIKKKYCANYNREQK